MGLPAMIVLDSSAIIDLFLATPRGEKVKEALREQPIGVTSITAHEVLVGVKEKDKDVWKNFFKSISVLPFDAEASYQSIEVENTLRKKGEPMAKLDLFIASICVLHKLPLYSTDNDFKEIKDLDAYVF